jgi:hypothetical protein
MLTTIGRKSHSQHVYLQFLCLHLIDFSETRGRYIWIRNFIWSSDFEKSKLLRLLGTKFALIDEIGLAWDHIHNETTILKLAWNYKTSQKHWIDLLKAITIRKHGYIRYHTDSSIRLGIKICYILLMRIIDGTLVMAKRSFFFLVGWQRICGIGSNA